MYPFGFGLTYSKSVFSGLSLSQTKLKKGSGVSLQVNVENTGIYDIDEVVQV